MNMHAKLDDTFLLMAMELQCLPLEDLQQHHLEGSSAHPECNVTYEVAVHAFSPPAAPEARRKPDGSGAEHCDGATAGEVERWRALRQDIERLAEGVRPCLVVVVSEGREDPAAATQHAAATPPLHAPASALLWCAVGGAARAAAARLRERVPRAFRAALRHAEDRSRALALLQRSAAVLGGPARRAPPLALCVLALRLARWCPRALSPRQLTGMARKLALMREEGTLSPSTLSCLQQELQRGVQRWGMGEAQGSGAAAAMPLPITSSVGTRCGRCGGAASAVPFSEASVWQRQRRYYARKGMGAWSRGEVPRGVSSGAPAAQAYAEVAVAWLRDCVAQGTVLDRSQPAYIVELGAGHCQLGFLVTKAIQRMLAEGQLGLHGLQVCVVMTDFHDVVLRERMSSACFRELLAAGAVDFAVLDAGSALSAAASSALSAAASTTRGHDDDGQNAAALDLLYSQRRLGPGSIKNPLLIMGNYVLDSLPATLYLSAEGGQVWEVMERAPTLSGSGGGSSGSSDSGSGSGSDSSGSDSCSDDDRFTSDRRCSGTGGNSIAANSSGSSGGSERPVDGRSTDCTTAGNSGDKRQSNDGGDNSIDNEDETDSPDAEEARVLRACIARGPGLHAIPRALLHTLRRLRALLHSGGSSSCCDYGGITATAANPTCDNTPGTAAADGSGSCCGSGGSGSGGSGSGGSGSGSGGGGGGSGFFSGYAHVECGSNAGRSAGDVMPSLQPLLPWLEVPVVTTAALLKTLLRALPALLTHRQQRLTRRTAAAAAAAEHTATAAAAAAAAPAPAQLCAVLLVILVTAAKAAVPRGDGGDGGGGGNGAAAFLDWPGFEPPSISPREECFAMPVDFFAAGAAFEAAMGTSSSARPLLQKVSPTVLSSFTVALTALSIPGGSAHPAAGARSASCGSSFKCGGCDVHDGGDGDAVDGSSAHGSAPRRAALPLCDDAFARRLCGGTGPGDVDALLGLLRENDNLMRAVSACEWRALLRLAEYDYAVYQDMLESGHTLDLPADKDLVAAVMATHFPVGEV
ncbi:hypothetical protein JKP88DRAFT_336999 [Tribonema minus]|uniref:Uncharacterized protein n=1 Tax=Tribonema minus TaxID=303371 RepID=A0A836C7W9_9STRA|nr:hypothetical protein JKP88DRAFT_336999 [Tribonema minus]